jgi:hypothetical protein
MLEVHAQAPQGMVSQIVQKLPLRYEQTVSADSYTQVTILYENDSVTATDATARAITTVPLQIATAGWAKAHRAVPTSSIAADRIGALTLQARAATLAC